MYICQTCGAMFLKPKEYYETHGFKYGPFEFFRECPECSSTYISETNNSYTKRED